jgi:hypothetical protein
VGRIFRKLGLPLWTFAGIGISAIWFNYLGTFFENLFRDGLKALNVLPIGFLEYGVVLLVMLVPFVVMAVLGVSLGVGRQTETGAFVNAELQQPEGKRGLILLVSNPESAMYAIAYHASQGRLEQVWLLPSDERDVEQFGMSTLPKAEEIRQRCADQFPRLTVEVIKHRISPADSQDTFDQVNRIYRQCGYEPGEMIADFTGGTKPMSVGMIMACLPSERELEYVSYSGGQSHGPFVVDYQHRAFDLIG